jgi:dihydrofolate reductase
MRKLILKMSMSLDGFVGSPKGELAWLFRGMDPEAIAWTVDAISQVGVHIMGSRTFRDMAAYWPTSTEPFAPPMNQIPKVVFSRSGLPGANSGSTTRALEDARAQAPRPLHDGGAALDSWAAARVASGDLTEEINRLKQEPGKDIMAHGGASFAQSLIECGLVDEYRLLVHPVVLGRGLAIFSKLAKPVDLQLIDAKTFPGGAVAHIYRPRG